MYQFRYRWYGFATQLLCASCSPIWPELPCKGFTTSEKILPLLMLRGHLSGVTRKPLSYSKDILLCLRGHKHPPSHGWESYLQEQSGRTPTDRPRRPDAKLEWKRRRKKAFCLCQPMPPCAKGCQLLRIWCRYASKYFILHVHLSERPLISRYL